MRRVLHTIRWDIVRQYRSGFYAVSLLLIPIVVGMLRWAGAGEQAAVVLPPLLVMMLLVTTFYFAGAILLLEKGEGTLAGLVVSPLRTGEYLLARTASLSLLAIVESLVIVVAGFGTAVNPLALLPGMVLLCAFYSLAGTAVITRYDTINEYLLPSVVFVILLMLPMLPYVGILESPLFLLHPVQPSIVLMRAAVLPAATPEIAYGVLGGAAWAGIAFVVARKSFGVFVVRSAGA
jgi:fluoroquinolone transport system permease protein